MFVVSLRPVLAHSKTSRHSTKTKALPAKRPTETCSAVTKTDMASRNASSLGRYCSWGEYARRSTIDWWSNATAQWGRVAPACASVYVCHLSQRYEGFVLISSFLKYKCGVGDQISFDNTHLINSVAQLVSIYCESVWPCAQLSSISDRLLNPWVYHLKYGMLGEAGISA